MLNCKSNRPIQVYSYIVYYETLNVEMRFKSLANSKLAYLAYSRPKHFQNQYSQLLVCPVYH